MATEFEAKSPSELTNLDYQLFEVKMVIAVPIYVEGTEDPDLTPFIQLYEDCIMLGFESEPLNLNRR